MEKLQLGRFKGYSFEHFRKDLLSGLIVGIVAIPLAMSFAIASGVKPEYGIYTTCIAGIIIALFGGSKYQIGGPTGAFVPILLGIVLAYGYEDLLLAGLMAGILLCLMGLFKLGSFIQFIPRPVTIGFTSGIAVLIFTGQIANFLGLTGVEKHEKFIANMNELVINMPTLNIYNVVVAALCLAVILVTPKIFLKVPGSLAGIIISTIVAILFFSGQVPTIGSAYGAIPNALPQFQMPEITWVRIERLIGPAFVIAMLGGIESLLSAVVADGMTKTRHNSNKELVGQGIANIVTPLFGGIPATGAIARTATNIKSGATSSMSGVIHGIFVLLVLLLFAPHASHIPLASMAPILMVVAWNMSERHHFMHILKLKSADSLVLVVTFLLTVLTSLTIAVEVGLGLALILFTKQMMDAPAIFKVLPDHSRKNAKVQPYVVNTKHDCPQISIYTMEGPLFFGAAQMFEETILSDIDTGANVLILRMSKVPFMDTTGEAYFSNIVQQFQGVILVTGLQPRLQSAMKKSGLYDEIGTEHFFEHTGQAIDAALRYLDRKKCIGCQHFAFRECTQLSKGVRQ
ncbi:SulP family inorganic anion transporter [Metasolibacillus meyeri]|uniref:SulP family inorganic anion transporter n=1 Tax=Metasolibacillus meyeri TaxID=1071052 RepID=UPI000D30CF6D|nr:sulfate permease [Metasolibacillus meyeri]